MVLETTLFMSVSKFCLIMDETNIGNHLVTQRHKHKDYGFIVLGSIAFHCHVAGLFCYLFISHLQHFKQIQFVHKEPSSQQCLDKNIGTRIKGNSSICLGNTEHACLNLKTSKKLYTLHKTDFFRSENRSNSHQKRLLLIPGAFFSHTRNLHKLL